MSLPELSASGAQVHRHLVQVRSRTLPDQGGEGQVPRPPCLQAAQGLRLASCGGPVRPSICWRTRESHRIKDTVSAAWFHRAAALVLLLRLGWCVLELAFFSLCRCGGLGGKGVGSLLVDSSERVFTRRVFCLSCVRQNCPVFCFSWSNSGALSVPSDSFLVCLVSISWCLDF